MALVADFLRLESIPEASLLRPLCAEHTPATCLEVAMGEGALKGLPTSYLSLLRIPQSLCLRVKVKLLTGVRSFQGPHQLSGPNITFPVRDPPVPPQ